MKIILIIITILVFLTCRHAFRKRSHWFVRENHNSPWHTENDVIDPEYSVHNPDQNNTHFTE